MPKLKSFWKVKITTKDGEQTVYRVIGKNDLDARAKAISLFAQREQKFLDDLKKKDAKSGDLQPDGAYQFKVSDIAYCETEHFGEWID